MYGIVYCATNLSNGKKYIGQTTRTLSIRIKAHIRESEVYSDHFHNTISKEGIDIFKWEIIEEGYDQTSLDDKERYWIGFYNTFKDHTKGYNMTPGGCGIGKRLPKEIIEKIIEGKKHLWKKVLCIETQEVYDTIATAKKITGIDDAHISCCCNGKRKSAGGFHWRYL
jgi:group I intron endonuclease